MSEAVVFCVYVTALAATTGSLFWTLVIPDTIDGCRCASPTGRRGRPGLTDPRSSRPESGSPARIPDLPRPRRLSRLQAGPDRASAGRAPRLAQDGHRVLGHSGRKPEPACCGAPDPASGPS